MDMRSTYLDTELMLVIRSKEINKQLEEGMMEYEKMCIRDRFIAYAQPVHTFTVALIRRRAHPVHGLGSVGFHAEDVYKRQLY